MKRSILSAAVLVLLLASAQVYAGPIVLDQGHAYPQTGEQPHDGYISPAYPFRAQTYTAGFDGFLAGIEIRAWHYDFSTPFTVDIRTVAGGVPTSVVLGSVTLPIGTPPHPISNYYIDLASLGIPQSVGTQYAIVIGGTTSGAWSYGRFLDNSVPDPYTGGSGWFKEGTLWKGIASDADYYFQTYVEQADSVPDPGSSLLLLGFALVGLRAWQKRWQ